MNTPIAPIAGTTAIDARLMSRVLGTPISDLEHLEQSIIDILTTPLGSRVYRREYGASLFALIDKNITPTWVSQVYGAISEALDKWEPRLQVSKLTVDATNQMRGEVVISIEGVYLPNGEPIRLEKVKLAFTSLMQNNYAYGGA